jgi:hypothetical protein
VREQQAKKGWLPAIAVSIVGVIAVVATVIGNLTTIADDIPKLWHAMFGSELTRGPQAEASKKITTASNNANTVEFLQSPIDQSNANWLAGLACRNLDHIVHLDISVDWPLDSMDEEMTGDRRLVLWNDTDEFLFPKGSYYMFHGRYIIKGYFIPRSGGPHQHVVSNAFDKVDDEQVILRLAPVENKMANDKCSS